MEERRAIIDWVESKFEPGDDLDEYLGWLGEQEIETLREIRRASTVELVEDFRLFVEGGCNRGRR